MSGNQNKAPNVGPPNQRFTTPYLQRPPTPRAETYHVNTAQFVTQQPPPQQQNPSGNQGPGGIRSMAPPNGPPNQASTPPNAELKVPQITPQASMNLSYVQPTQVRGTQNFFSRGPQQANPTPRMSNHRQAQQQQLYTHQAPYVLPQVPQLYMTTPGMQYNFNNAQRYMQPMMPSQGFPYPYHQTQSQPSHTATFYYPSSLAMQRAAPPQVVTAPQNIQQAQPNMPLPPPQQQYNTLPTKNKTRTKAIPIIDPNTGLPVVWDKDKASETYNEHEDSHPPSGESSARQTPQPSQMCKEIQATFAKQVAQANNNNNTITTASSNSNNNNNNNEETSLDDVMADHHPHHHRQSHVDHIESHVYHNNNANQAVQNANRLDLAQSSKLQAQTKEFIPSQSVTTTPVVSAMADGIEVTINNKGKESPNKSSKTKREYKVEQQQQQIIKEEKPMREEKQQQQPQQQQQQHQQQHKENVAASCMTNSDNTKSMMMPVVTPPPSVILDEKKGNNGRREKIDSISKSRTNFVGDPNETSSNVLPNVTTQENAKNKTANQRKDTSNKQQQQQQQQSSSQMPVPAVAQKPQHQQQQSGSSPPAQQQLQQQQASVPQSQPAKPNNKTNKMRDLNIKGASKEGTDMDAFQDNNNTNLITSNDNNVTNVNANNNVPPIVNNNNSNVNIINNNDSSSSCTDNNAATNNNLLNVISDVHNNKESNETCAIPATTTTPPPSQPQSAAAPATVTMQTITKQQQQQQAPPTTVPQQQQEIKPKKCVTDIVKDVPPKVTNFYPLQATNSQENKLGEKKLSKSNDVAAKSLETANSSNKAETNRPNLPYKDGQWSPMNPTGKKVYDIELLYLLKDVEKSRAMPTNVNIPTDIIAQDDRNRVDNINRFAAGGNRTNDFTPNFGNTFAGKSSSRSAPVKRNSQSKLGGASKGSKSNIMRVSISVKEDVKLHESENAWRPARLNPGTEQTEDDKKTNELYKKVRGILNKLTPQKFDTLVNQVRTLAIDTTARLQGVIDLTFEKAIDEPNFSVAYALLCRELALMQVPASTAAEKNATNDFVNFRKLLVTRCQMEFEKNSVDEKARNDRVIEIEKCTNLEKKKELQINLEEDDRRIRMKSVGYIRFIGELFKQNMLTASIMMRCLSKLLENKDEESLECLCKLLTTVGKELETNKNNDLSAIFNAMKDIADRRACKVSSRIRFMIQDVIDLRHANWQPRRQDLNPTTMDQIQKEAHDEHLSIQALNAMSTPRKDDRNNSGMNSQDRKRGNRNMNNNNGGEDGWSTAGNGRNRSYQLNIQSDKLKTKPPQVDEPFGSRQMFDWGRGSNVKSSMMSSTTATNSPNMYAALESIGNDIDKRSLDMRGGPGARSSSTRDPYSSKGPSMERTYSKQQQPAQMHDRRSGMPSGGSSRSGSQQRGSTPVSSGMPSKPMYAPNVPSPMVVPPPPASTGVAEFTQEKLEMKFKTILEEYVNECLSIDEFSEEMRIFPVNELDIYVVNGCLSMLERSKTARLKCGELFAKLIKMGSLPVAAYLKGLGEVLGQVDELVIDIPKLWDYLPEIISPILTHEALPLITLEQTFKVLKEQNSNNMIKFLGPLFKMLITDKGPGFVENLWQASGLRMADLIPADSVDDFLKENNLGFLIGAPVTQQSTLSYEEIHGKLLELFQNNTPFDNIKKWISANVGERTTESKFIRLLFDAILQNSIHNGKLKAEVLEGHQKTLVTYVQHNPEYELQCLYTLQLHMHKLQYPQGLLFSICDRLYDVGIFSQEGFLAWEANDNPAEQEGKGVAVKQLTSFFTQLKEVEEETASSSSEDP